MCFDLFGVAAVKEYMHIKLMLLKIVIGVLSMLFYSRAKIYNCNTFVFIITTRQTSSIFCLYYFHVKLHLTVEGKQTNKPFM